MGMSRWMDLQTALYIHQDFRLAAGGPISDPRIDNHLFQLQAMGMDQEQEQKVLNLEIFAARDAMKYSAAGLACLACGGSAVFFLARRSKADAADTVFKGDAPSGKLWELWRKRGWVQEARHYLKLGENVQCKLCPNECLLEPEDRGHCRNRVHKDGKLYTLAYGNPCAVHVDPIEKKPLMHFLPGTGVFSLATAGCGFRCLNCQNWNISQRKPEETKDPRGEAISPYAA